MMRGNGPTALGLVQWLWPRWTRALTIGRSCCLEGKTLGVVDVGDVVVDLAWKKKIHPRLAVKSRF
jgi:hypothetical protein